MAGLAIGARRVAEQRRAVADVEADRRAEPGEHAARSRLVTLDRGAVEDERRRVVEVDGAAADSLVDTQVDRLIHQRDLRLVVLDLDREGSRVELAGGV